MSDTPTLFRAGVLTALGLFVALTLLAQAYPADRLPGGAELAARLMAPLADREELGTEEALVEDNARPPEQASAPPAVRIHAEPAPDTSVVPATDRAKGTGIDPSLKKTPTERVEEVAEPPTALDETAELFDATVKNVGDSEGQRMAVSELGGLDRTIADRLLTEGAAALVVDLEGGRQFMLKIDGGNAFAGMTFVPWGPHAADYSQLQVVFSPETNLLPTAALRPSLLKVAGPMPVNRYALVLSAGTEQTLRAAQHDLLAEAGQDLDALLAEGRSIVTRGCWQARGPLMRLTAAAVDGTTWHHPSRRGC